MEGKPASRSCGRDVLGVHNGCPARPNGPGGTVRCMKSIPRSSSKSHSTIIFDVVDVFFSRYGPEFRLALDTFRPAAVAMLTCLGVAVSELRAGEWPFGGCAASGPYALARVGRALCALRKTACAPPIQRRRSSLACSIISRWDEAVIRASGSLYVLIPIS
jgi:hypothetical protein